MPSALPDGYRFRHDWRGKLILQRQVETRTGDAWDTWTVSHWRDATTEDLTHFFTTKDS